jgi:hypothetical protein
MVLLLEWLEVDKINDDINNNSGLLSLVAARMHGGTR